MDEPEECSSPNLDLPSVPQQFLLRDLAPRPRTLWDIITTTAEIHPEAAALDDGEIITYAELIHEVELWATELHANGVRRGDRIGIRMTSGKRELYLAILATLAAGAAYVPVDADDPDERAEMVFGEAGIASVVETDMQAWLRSHAALVAPLARLLRHQTTLGPGRDAEIVEQVLLS